MLALAMHPAAHALAALLQRMLAHRISSCCCSLPLQLPLSLSYRDCCSYYCSSLRCCCSELRLLLDSSAAAAAAWIRLRSLDRSLFQIPFRRFFYRGYEVHKLLDLTHAELMKLLHARARRHFARGSTSKAGAKLLKRLRSAKKDAPENEKPETVKTHLRNTVRFTQRYSQV